MPRIKKQIQHLGDCVVLEEWTETYNYRVDLGDRVAYLDEESVKGAGLIRVDKKDGGYKSSSYTRVEYVPGLSESLDNREKGEWTFVFETESDYS